MGSSTFRAGANVSEVLRSVEAHMSVGPVNFDRGPPVQPFEVLGLIFLLLIGVVHGGNHTVEPMTRQGSGLRSLCPLRYPQGTEVRHERFATMEKGRILGSFDEFALGRKCGVGFAT